MEKRIITTEQIVSFGQFLREDERSTATVEKYLREVRLFAAFLNGTEVTKSSVAAWKAHLLEENYNPTTVNGKLSAIDRFFSFKGWEDCRVKHLRLQRRLFRESNQELTKEEYERLIATAEELGKSGCRCSWRPSAPRAFGSARCNISPWKLPTPVRRRSR